MTSEQIIDKLKNILNEQLGITEDKIKPESHFIEDIGCDSLDVVEIIMAAEEVFEEATGKDCYFEDDLLVKRLGMEKNCTFGNAVKLIEDRLAGTV